MKQIYLYFATLLLTLAVHGEKSPRTSRAQQKLVKAVGAVQFRLSTPIMATTHKDSVLVIFDRCDHTGAGVIYQVFYADKDHNLTIPAVPAGKYYVTLQYLGMHRDRIEKIVRIKSQKNEKVKISLQDSEEFFKDKVVIPAYAPNFADFAVLKMK